MAAMVSAVERAGSTTQARENLPREKFVGGINRVIMITALRQPQNLLDKVKGVTPREIDDAIRSGQNQPRGSAKAACSRAVSKYIEHQYRPMNQSNREHEARKYEMTARALKLVEGHFDRVLLFSRDNMGVDKQSLIQEFFGKSNGGIGYVYLEICMQPLKDTNADEAEELVVDFLASKKIIECGPYRQAKSKALKDGNPGKRALQRDEPKDALPNSVQANSTSLVQPSRKSEDMGEGSRDGENHISLTAQESPGEATSAVSSPHQNQVKQVPGYEPDRDPALGQGEHHPVEPDTCPTEIPVSISKIAGGDPEDMLKAMTVDERGVWRGWIPMDEERTEVL